MTSEPFKMRTPIDMHCAFPHSDTKEVGPAANWFKFQVGRCSDRVHINPEP
jgi:hypothetical protein